jgi:hypothetical protein
MVAAKADVCWEDLVAEFRRNYYDAFDEIVPALLASDDPFITFNCVRLADLSQPKEVKALQDFIRTCDPEKHQVSLRALAETRVAGIRERLAGKSKGYRRASARCWRACRRRAAAEQVNGAGQPPHPQGRGTYP